MYTLVIKEALNFLKKAATSDLNNTRLSLLSIQKTLMSAEAKGAIKVCLHMVDEELTKRPDHKRLH